MKTRFMFYVMSILLLTTATLHAESLINCTTVGSASLGDLKQEVRLACGEPERIEIIGYIDKIQNEERIRVMKIEEWIFLVPHYGKQNFYSLIFEGNKLVKIDNAGSK